VELTVFFIEVESSVNITKNLVAFTIDELHIQRDKVAKKRTINFCRKKKILKNEKRDLSKECNNKNEHKGKLSEV